MNLINTFVTNYDKLLNFAFSICDNEQAAQDIVQDAFIRIARLNVKTDYPLNYALSAVRWTALNRRRGLKNLAKHVGPDALDNEPSDEPGPDEVLKHKQLVGVLKFSMASLPKKQFTILNAYLNDVGPREYARASGLNEETAAANYRHGISGLKILMGAA